MALARSFITLLGLALTSISAFAQGDPPRAFNASTAAVRPAGTKVRIDLIGDSTQTDNAGYGRGFCANLTSQVDCLNMAGGGASTKTYREMGLWDNALATKPDYMLIQFGHNDMESKEHLDRQVPIAQYKANLRRFVEEARAAGVKPVLVTPLTRRYFGPGGKVHSNLVEHATTMKRVAEEEKVPLIDLHTDSIAYLDKIGEAKGAALGITKKDTDGKTIPDKTHLNWAGSYAFGRIVAADLAKTVPALKPYIHPEAAPLPSQGIKAMKILQGGPVKIVLVGDSTVNAEGGWGKGFCDIVTANVTCINDALNGRSSKSFIDEGDWTKALGDKGDYYLIQFGHNDQKKDTARATDADTTYAANLRRYIRDTRAIEAIPVIVTSLSRRNYCEGKLVEDLTAYVDAAKRIAAEENVAMIDLNAMSVHLLKGMTQEQADAFDADTHPDASAENKGQPVHDRTHLNAKGQILFGRMVADRLVRMEVELGPDIVGEPAASSSR
jgi:lysophospholipase L1-like esterase